jgi:hypothetical protein
MGLQRDRGNVQHSVQECPNLAAVDPAQIDSDFDYWLYVVERQENGELKVLPIRNVARRAARFGLKGGSWRHEVEQGDSDAGSNDTGAPAPGL